MTNFNAQNLLNLNVFAGLSGISGETDAGHLLSVGRFLCLLVSFLFKFRKLFVSTDPGRYHILRSIRTISLLFSLPVTPTRPYVTHVSTPRTTYQQVW